ncbi:hypothetical protein [Mesorhizobium argentiipisi]|uniref:Propionyl-coenzyme A carboxylase alpha polypeptide n=1 Tax=Mesorhizobium argentiipisi TaxID=3015175 RepID=A0ABU8KHP5_9HYPH
MLQLGGAAHPARIRQRLIPLEHPSSVSALRADPPSPTRGEGKKTNFNQLLIFFARASGQGESALIL